MTSTFTALAPVFAGFVIGYLLKYFGVVERRDGEFLFRLVFYVCSPALVFGALSTVELRHELLALPAVSAVIAAVGFAVGTLLSKRLGLTPLQQPLFVIACIIVNTGFALPFIQAVYGAEGVVALAAFDLVNATLTYTWVHAIAAQSNPHHTGESVLLRKLITSPPLYATIAGLLVNLLHISPPDFIQGIAATFGRPTGFVITLAIGIVFNARVIHLRGSVVALAVRLACTVVIGLAAVALLDPEPATKGVILLLCVAPIGFNTVTFASLEKLDVDFASSTLSLSLVVGVVLTTLVAALV